jgi:hypothetical protein
MQNNGESGRLESTATFQRANVAIIDGEDRIILDWALQDFRPGPVQLGLVCTLDDIRKVVHNCLKALDYFGD